MQLIPVSRQRHAPASLSSVAADHTASAAQATPSGLPALTGMVGCIGSPAFAHEALAQLNRWLPVSWWSVFRLHDEAPPTMPLAGSYRAADHTGDSWQAYRRALYRRDETFVAARERVADDEDGALLVHWHAREIAARHRERIYTRHGLRERLSIVRRTGPQALLAVNLYRHEVLPTFGDTEIDELGAAAPLLLACVQRHLALATHAPGPATALALLTRREREVCERLLKGWTHDGIAADLGLSPGTVKTYRDRAFDRLGIHQRHQLFALVAGRLA